MAPRLIESIFDMKVDEWNSKVYYRVKYKHDLGYNWIESSLLNRYGGFFISTPMRALIVTYPPRKHVLNNLLNIIPAKQHKKWVFRCKTQLTIRARIDDFINKTPQMNKRNIWWIFIWDCPPIQMRWMRTNEEL